MSKTVSYSNPSNLSTCNFFEIRYKISQTWKLDNICPESRVKHVDHVCQHHQLKNEFQMNWIKVNWKWNRWINRWAAFDIHRRNEVFDDGEYLKAKENASLCEREPHPKLLNSAHSLAGKFLFFLFKFKENEKCRVSISDPYANGVPRTAQEREKIKNVNKSLYRSVDRGVLLAAIFQMFAFCFTLNSFFWENNLRDGVEHLATRLSHLSNSLKINLIWIWMKINFFKN